MLRYLSKTPKKEYPGFRIWLTDEPGNDSRCYCGWFDGREHYGTVGRVDAEGNALWRGERIRLGH